MWWCLLNPIQVDPIFVIQSLWLIAILTHIWYDTFFMFRFRSWINGLHCMAFCILTFKFWHLRFNFFRMCISLQSPIQTSICNGMFSKLFSPNESCRNAFLLKFPTFAAVEMSQRLHQDLGPYNLHNRCSTTKGHRIMGSVCIRTYWKADLGRTSAISISKICIYSYMGW